MSTDDYRTKCPRCKRMVDLAETKAYDEIMQSRNEELKVKIKVRCPLCNTKFTYEND